MREYLVPLFLLIALAAAASADNVSLEQFGGKADGKTDNGVAFAKAVAYAAAHPGTTIHLGGVCRIATAQVHGPPYHMAEGLTGVANLTIEDGEILLSGAFGGFQFKKCPGLTLRNVVFDYDPPILSQGRVLASDQKHVTITVKPDPGYPSPADPLQLGHNWLTVHKPNGEYAYFFVGYPKSATPVGDGSFVLAYDRGDMAAAIAGATDLRYVFVERSYGHLMTFEFCDGVRMENCTIHATSAFASLFSFCNDVKLIGNKICPRKGSDTIVSTCADGFDFIGARRGPEIAGNFFDHMQDDNIVISLRGNHIISTSGTQLQLAPQSGTYYETGDTIEVVSPDENARREYKIVSMPPQKYLWAPTPITLDRPLEGKIAPKGAGGYPTLVFNKSWRLDGTWIHDNTFQNTRRYAVFMGAGGVRIEHNTMSNFTNAALLLSFTEDLRKDTGELNYYPSEDVTVKGNMISHMFDYGEGGRVFKSDTDPEGAIDVYDNSRERIGIRDFHFIRNLDIEDNTITDSGGVGIHMANATGVTVRNNTITNANLRGPKRCGIWIEAAPDAVVTGNTVQGTGIDKAIQIDP